MKKRIFVSDVHMSKGLSLDDPSHQYDWLADAQAESFANFLKYTINDGFDELILVGDVLDDWVYPIKVRPPHYADIAAARRNPAIMDLLKQIAQDKTKTVTYVVGNHDMTIKEYSIPDFGNGRGANIAFRQYYESSDGVLAQHGHQFGMYNAPDPDNLLPLGHYISRLYANVTAGTGVQERWQGKIPGAVGGTIAGVLNPFVNVPLNHLAGQLGIDDSESIVTIDGGTVSLGDIRRIYADLPDRWVKSNGILGPIESALEETPMGLDSEAENLAKRFGKKLVVFGHTHLARIQFVYTWFHASQGTEDEAKEIAIYANCGSWCQNNAQYTYVVDEYDESTTKHKVTLMSWLPTNRPIGGPLTI